MALSYISIPALFDYFYNDIDRFGEPRDVQEIIDDMQCPSNVESIRSLLLIMVEDGELIEESGLFRAFI